MPAAKTVPSTFAPAPEVVTVVAPENMAIGPFKVSNTCGCMAFWRDRDYQGTKYPPNQEYANAQECEEMILRQMIGIATTTIDEEEDSQFTTAFVAQSRNRATAIMGYVVGNPEAAWGNENRHLYQSILDEYKINVRKGK